MHIKTHKFFNQLTQQALLDHVDGYVDKTKSISTEIIKLRSRFGVEKIYRFDLGENVDGFSYRVNSFLEKLYHDKRIFDKLNEYPNITHRQLRQEIARFHNISRDQIVLSTGLDSILDLITRVFFEYNDFYLMPIPDFFLFESYSERMGAKPIFLNLKEEDNFAWTDEIVEKFEDYITRFKPKIAWISNPSNPSGQIIPKEVLKKIIEVTHDNNVFLVIDEAYGEYNLDPGCSAVPYLQDYKNLMVLRTFSKAYGLAGIRLGYLMSSSKEIIKALLLHRHHFPATQLAQRMASIALLDQVHINRTIQNNNYRKKELFEKLSSLKTFKFIPSTTNIFMLKNNCMSDEKLHLLLKQKGIFTSMLQITGIQDKNYLRVTIRSTEDNEVLFQACSAIEEEIIKSIQIDQYNFSMF